MPNAMLMLLDQPKKAHDAEAFAAGLKSCGYTVTREIKHPRPDDLLVIWNRQGPAHTWAKRFESGRAKVLVIENGYLGADWRGDRWYAMAQNHHNGWGAWPHGAAERWDSWAVPILPYRPPGGETVLLAQRGIGEPAMRCPERWVADMARKYSARIRRHPGTSLAGPTLEEDLRAASLVVTWSSGAALKAMLMGIRVYVGLPKWIGSHAARPVGWKEHLDDQRLPMFRRLAWAQWSRREVESGEALRRVLT